MKSSHWLTSKIYTFIYLTNGFFPTAVLIAIEDLKKETHLSSFASSNKISRLKFKDNC